MRVLITGSTGYIGRRVVAAIIGSLPDVSILALCRDVDKADAVCNSARCRNLPVREMYDAVAGFRPEMVLHLAALSTSRDDTGIIDDLVDSNITFGVKLLDAVSAAGSLRLFVNVGSFAEYRLGIGGGLDDAYLYTATKSAFRHFVGYYASKCGFRYLTAVPYTVYGGDDTAKKLMDYMVESIGADIPVKMTPGHQILDFIHVDDIVRFFVETVRTASLSSGISAMPQGLDFHLGTGVGTEVRRLADIIACKTGRRLNIEWGGREYRPLDVMHAVAPVGSNDKTIDWYPQISLSEGIDRLLYNHIGK
ncbi:MAG: NAD-dependent epimerase/dehydratase family protein [Candidatus Aphodosoma sp.]